MKSQKILRNFAIIVMIVCIIILAIDLFKVLKINVDFLGMQSSSRISSSSNAAEVKYEPTDYMIANKDDALDEIKKITVDLKNEYVESNKKEEAFEIANIHKLSNFFYTYDKYAVVKYKLLNIIEDLPILYKATQGSTDAQLKSYFNNNIMHIENYYGITSSDEFINLANTLSFLGNGKIKNAIVLVESINFDYDNDILDFSIELVADNGQSTNYYVKAHYYKTSDNQVTPYVSFNK